MTVKTDFINNYVSANNNNPEIIINLWKKELYLIENGNIVETFPIAPGTSLKPTPVGEFKIIKKAKDWGDGFGTRWIGLNVPWGTYGIHGTNKPWSIGLNISSGCIRMYNKDVEKLYETVTVGTKVQIDGPIIGLGDGYYITLAVGSRGNLVQLVQNRLKAAGYYYKKPNGIYDGYTENAVKKYQRANKLPATGWISYRDYIRLGLIE